MPLEPGGTSDPHRQKSQWNDTVIQAKLGEWSAQGRQKGKTVGAEQISSQVPDHYQTAKGNSCQEKTPKIDFAVILRREHEVVHSKKTTHQPGAESAHNEPDQQQYQMAAEVQHQQSEWKREVNLAKIGHFWVWSDIMQVASGK